MSKTVEDVRIDGDQVEAFFITDWLLDSPYKWPSQYGMVTNREWLLFEADRIPGAEMVKTIYGKLAAARRMNNAG